VGKKMGEIGVVISGAGAAGTAIANFLISAGVRDIVCCDIDGIIYRGRKENNRALEELAEKTNEKQIKGNLADAMRGKDLFIGVSAPGIVTEEIVRSMAPDPIIFAMANPISEIMPDEAKKAGARIVATGRSDFPNQINNCLGFPGIFKGALEVRASDINEEMKLAAAYAIASLVGEDELSEDKIIPNAFDPRVVEAVSKAVAIAARKSGVAGRS
jgi:malate dehydrogenase (oxaloacetate-decarboxylating)